MSEPLQILLVEDNRGDADLTKELIKDTGIAHSVTWLDDGEKAIEFLSEGKKADLIIIDLNLPIVSGHEIIKFLRVRGLCKTTPVIILTGSNSPMDLEKAKKNGVVCYLIKPMTIEEMDRITRTFKAVLSGEMECNC
jgi:two-component system, chemotaxis family, response regulator Rcp1